jgi:hypothetical protein
MHQELKLNTLDFNLIDTNKAVPMLVAYVSFHLA